MTTALVAVGELERMANAVAASKLFGITNPEQALALMLVAQAEGLHPATAARDYHIVNGRPTLKADAMLARYLHSGGKVEWHEHTDQKVSATFSHPAGGSLKIEWDFARAKTAGLGSKDMWVKYPRQMLRARVISEGIRATNPSVAVGIYTPEEVSDFEPSQTKGKGAKAKDMGNAEVVTDTPQPPQAPRTADNPPADSSPQPAGADQRVKPEDRQAILVELCSRTKGITLTAVLSKAGVEKAEELSSDDFEQACAMLRRKAAK